VPVSGGEFGVVVGDGEVVTAGGETRLGDTGGSAFHHILNVSSWDAPGIVWSVPKRECLYQSLEDKSPIRLKCISRGEAQPATSASPTPICPGFPLVRFR
jgi:hypothetical protein